MFRKNFETGKERDAQLCVYVEGRRVIDLWGSAEGDETYNGDSLQCVFSSSKAITAMAIASIADQGLINYSNTVASYFPEFSENAKGDVKVEDLLRHESGLANIHTAINPKDLHPQELEKGTVAKIIAKDYQVFPKNTVREYHNLTGGWIMNEIFRRVTPDKITIGSWLRREYHEGHGIDVHMGLTESELARTRPLEAIPTPHAMLHSLIPNAFGAQVEHNIFVFSKILSSFKRRFTETEKRGFAAMFEGVDPGLDPGVLIPEFMNSPDWRLGESPHGNVHASARALAMLAGAMANGGQVEGKQIISPTAWILLHNNPIVREDAYMNGCRTEFTQGGVNMFKDYHDDKFGERVLKSGRHGFTGWMGFGGSIIQWHTELKLGFGYACTFMTWWDMANIKARKLQKEVVVCTKRINEEKIDEKIDENNNVK
ncbi:uncharacterized protein LOC111699384 isoform X2 [Eurytemora carolleeae]|nr:uncharacterized protein LOC111699384 isoform X2 [Eurytemora carolleeae]|eukprot:XP_023325826.1 uncharacterized protein LOC111699384 isoform X2 [Eurytemora affinis]